MDSDGGSASKLGVCPSQGTHKNLPTSRTKMPIFGVSGASAPPLLGSRFSTLGATSNKLAKTGFLNPSAAASSSARFSLRASSAAVTSDVRFSLEGTSAANISSATSTSAVKPLQTKRSLVSVNGLNSERKKVNRTPFKGRNLFSNIPQERTDFSPLLNAPSPQFNDGINSNVMQSLSDDHFDGGSVVDFLNEIKCDKGDLDIDVDLPQIQCDEGDIDIDLFNEINCKVGDEEITFNDFNPNDVHHMGKSKQSNKKLRMSATKSEIDHSSITLKSKQISKPPAVKRPITSQPISIVGPNIPVIPAPPSSSPPIPVEPVESRVLKDANKRKNSPEGGLQSEKKVKTMLPQAKKSTRGRPRRETNTETPSKPVIKDKVLPSLKFVGETENTDKINDL